VRSLLAVLLLAPLLACGPVQASRALVAADVELEGARSAGAPAAASQEFASAEAYLRKAREKNGYAQYEAAAALAERSIERSQAARKKAVAAGPVREPAEAAP
jgi:hypothetical protein